MNRNKAELFVDTDLNYVPFIETPDAYGANKADINYFENEDTQTCLVAYVDESGGIYNPHVNCTSSKSSSTESDVYSCTRLLDNNCSDNHVAVTDATTNATIAEMALKLGHSLSQDYDARMALNNADCDYDVWTKIQNSMTNSLRRNYLKKTQCEKKRGFISRCLRGITNNKLSQLLLLTIVVCAFVILVIAVLTVKSYHFSRIVKSDANDDASDQYTNNNREEEWWKSGIFYEIFTASFKDTNSDGFGDIDGIKQKLPYLKELGVNVLRLNSIFSALDYPYQYEHVIDFVNVDPHIGTLNSFKSLVREIHKQGMYIVLDINPTVTSDQHPWAAHWLLNSTGKYRYFFVDNKHITAESTSSTAVDRKTSEMEETHLSFGGHLYLNWSHASVVRNMLECMRFWVRTGIDGFFLRNLEQIKIDDQFPEALFQILDNIRDVLNDQIANNVASEKSYRSGRKRILIASRRSLQSLSQRIQMQLTTKYFTTNKNKSKNVARNGSQLFEDHSSENDHYNNKDVFSHFDLVDTLLEINLNKTENIREQVNSVFLNNHNSDFWVLWSVGTSTTSRLASRIGSDYIAAAAFLLTMLPGSINILYGDEIGLKDSVDPVTNKEYRGGQLCPMPWSPAPNAEFSTENSTLWMPLNSNFVKNNVKRQSESVSRMHQLIHFRRNNFIVKSIKKHGNYLFHYINDGEIVLERYFSNATNDGSVTRERFVLFANLGNEVNVKSFLAKFHFANIEIASNPNRLTQFFYIGSLRLDPGEAIIARLV